MAATSRPLARVPSASDKPPLPPVDVPQDAATTAAGDEAQTPAPSAAVADDADVRPAAPLPRRSLFQLALQHALSSWGTRSYEFAAPLFFIHAYSASLLAASLYGCLTTLAAILLAGSAGRLVDVYAARKRAMLRGAVAVQSVALAAAYALFATLLNVDHLGRNAENAGTGPERGSPNADVWTLFAAITAVGCVVTLANVSVSVSIERDWVTSIAAHDSRTLSRLNAIMRRIDLLTKLLAPLFVSLLTSTAGYPRACFILLGFALGGGLLQLLLIGRTYACFPALAADEARVRALKLEQQEPSPSPDVAMAQSYPPRRVARAQAGVRSWLQGQVSDWRVFVRMPVFPSSVSLALLYMSALSFDPAFIGYLKSETYYSDAMVAGMRGLCVVTGLGGTFLAPYLISRIGLTRTGTWALAMLLLPLLPTLLALFLGAGPGRERPAWNGALLFGGMAASRVGLWSFDLAQLQMVQEALSTHPRRNSLMALQVSLQNLFDLGHYGLTIGWSLPSQFKYAALTSYCALLAAGVIYVGVYARRDRGHVLHLGWLRLHDTKSR